MELELQGITHIYYTPSGLERLGRTSAIYRLDSGMRERLESWLSDLTVLYRDKNYILYRVGQF